MLTLMNNYGNSYVWLERSISYFKEISNKYDKAPKTYK